MMMNEKLNSSWVFRRPIDFEYNKYVALNYIKSSEHRLNDLKIYPDLHDITLNLINIASIGKDSKTISLTRKLNEYDDEIELGDFKYDEIPELMTKDKNEVNRTINFTYPKFLDLFNFAKSIWTLAFENIDVKLKKNKSALSSTGYLYFFDKAKKLLYIYSFDILLNDGKYSTNSSFNEIYCGDYGKISLISVFDKLKEKGYDTTKQTYEVITTQEFPVRETILPIAKRKIIFKNIDKL
jgi:hypothetical protein